MKRGSDQMKGEMSVNTAKTFKIGEVPQHLRERYGFNVTRQTVYNWISKGLRNETLRVEKVPGHPTARIPVTLTTTDEWIAEFFNRAGIQVTPQ